MFKNVFFARARKDEYVQRFKGAIIVQFCCFPPPKQMK